MSDMAIRYEYNGLRGMERIALEYDIPVGTLKNRIYSYGMTIEEAVEAGPGPRVRSGPRTTYEWNGLEGLPAICEATGISKATLTRRIYDKGMTIDEAIAMGVNKRKRRNGNVIARRVAKADEEDKRRIVGIRHPDLLDPKWKLALGMRTSL